MVHPDVLHGVYRRNEAYETRATVKDAAKHAKARRQLSRESGRQDATKIKRTATSLIWHQEIILHQRCWQGQEKISATVAR